MYWYPRLELTGNIQFLYVYIWLVYSRACAYTKLRWDSRSVVLSGYAVSLLLGTGSGVISFGGCLLVDRIFSVVVVDIIWLWLETLVHAWLPSRQLTLAKMQIF